MKLTRVSSILYSAPHPIVLSFRIFFLLLFFALRLSSTNGQVVFRLVGWPFIYTGRILLL